jgi:hypothetical protein
LKSKFTQRRYRAPKRSACALCKPHQQGWADKKTFTDVRRAVADEHQLRDWEAAAGSTADDFANMKAAHEG